MWSRKKRSRKKRRQIREFREKEQFWLSNAPHNIEIYTPTDVARIRFQIASHLFYSYLPVSLRNAFDKYCIMHIEKKGQNHPDDEIIIFSKNFFKDLWTILYLKELSNVSDKDFEKKFENEMIARYEL